MCLILARRLDVSEEELPLAAVAVKHAFFALASFFKKRVMALKTQNKKLLWEGMKMGGSERSGRWR